MNITALDHITINCRDIRASLDFYKEIMGLNALDSIDMGDHCLYYLQLPGCRLELIDYVDAQKTVEAGTTDVGVYRHFAVVVDNIKEMEARCRENGYAVRLGPVFLEKLGKTIMLIEDPNKVEIEIIQND